MSEIEVIVHHHCKLAEGPLWHPDERRFYWTDIENGRLYRYDLATGASEVCLETDKIGGMTIQKDGSLLLFMARGAIKRWDGETVQVIHAEIAGETETRFNDLIADPVGRVFCGLMPTKTRKGHLYRLNTDGSLALVLDEVACSNGMAFLNDNQQVLFTDSGPKEISVFDYEVETGEISNRRTFWKSETEEYGPDGLTVDAEGCVWTAQWGGGCVIRLDPNGREIGRLAVPGAKNITSVIFGGDNLSDLYITSAAANDPNSENAGAIFRANVGVRGLPEYRSDIAVPA